MGGDNEVFISSCGLSDDWCCRRSICGDFSSSQPPLNSLQFGDAFVYSIGFLNFNETGNPKNGSFTVASNNVTPDLAIIANSNGNADNSEVRTSSMAADDAYVQAGGSNFFSTGAAADPTPSFTGDAANTWDISVPILNSIVNGNLLWFFDFNEPGNATVDPIRALNGESMLAWASFTLENTTTNATETFYLSNPDNDASNGPTPSANSYGPFEQGLGVTGPGFDDDWVTVHGTITVDENGAFQHFGPKNPGDPNNWQEIDQNLGNDRAEFAFILPDLNDELANGDWDFLRVDVRMARTDNGKEQLFIVSDFTNREVIPEPMSFLVWSGLASVVCLTINHRRRLA